MDIDPSHEGDVSLQTDEQHFRDPPSADGGPTGRHDAHQHGHEDSMDWNSESKEPPSAPANKKRDRSPSPPRSRKKMTLDVAKEKYPDLYIRTTYWDERSATVKERSQPEEESAYSDGIMIVDGLSDVRTDLLFKYIMTESPALASTNRMGDWMRRLPKGGVELRIRPAEALEWERLMRDFNPKRAISVHPPRSSRDGNNRAVMVFNVDPRLTDNELVSGLLPKPCRVIRLHRNERPLRTIKVVYPTRQIAAAVVDVGHVTYDDCILLRAEAPRKRKPTLYCKVCKKVSFECHNRVCKDLRCGYCGEAHPSSKCEAKQESLPCLHCHEEGHSLFKCPALSQAHEERAARKKEQARARRQRQRQKRQEQRRAAGSQTPSYADIVRPQPVMANVVSAPSVNASASAMGLSFGLEDVAQSFVRSLVKLWGSSFPADVQKALMQSTIDDLKSKGLWPSPGREPVAERQNSPVQSPQPAMQPVQEPYVEETKEHEPPADYDDQPYGDPHGITQQTTLDGHFVSAQSPKARQSQNNKPRPKKKKGKKSPKHKKGDIVTYYELQETPIPQTARVVCSCGREFNPKGWATHRGSCKDYTTANKHTVRC